MWPECSIDVFARVSRCSGRWRRHCVHFGSTQTKISLEKISFSVLKQLLNKRFQLLVKINKINSASVDSAASNLQNKENCIHSDSAYSHERVVLLCWGDLCFPPNWTQRCCCFYWSELLLCWCCWQKAIHKQSAQTWKRKTGLSFFLGSFFFSSSSDPPHPHVLSKGTVLHDQFHLCVSYRHRCRTCLA